MGETSIRHSLAKLHEHLQKTVPNDDEGRNIINTLNNDIEVVLAQPDPLTTTNFQGLGKHLSIAIQHFEATHPNLIHALNTIAKLLSEGGI
ncbi:MAG: hypothetical protein CUN52_06040 [Phototrophicales bacterium]|jgi:hypothetical protein|nr:MAG: hypothetical protein CUN52_06040 [Phototrophicales bacterium]